MADRTAAERMRRYRERKRASARGERKEVRLWLTADEAAAVRHASKSDGLIVRLVETALDAANARRRVAELEAIVTEDRNIRVERDRYKNIADNLDQNVRKKDRELHAATRRAEQVEAERDQLRAEVDRLQERIVSLDVDYRDKLREAQQTRHAGGGEAVEILRQKVRTLETELSEWREGDRVYTG